MAGDIEMGLTQKLKEKAKLGMMFVGFICSCGLYEFGGVFWMTYFNPFLQTAVGKKTVVNLENLLFRDIDQNLRRISQIL